MSHYPDQQKEYNEECNTQRGSKMIKFYEDKADFKLNKEKAVVSHKKEYLNYIEMLEHMRSQQLTETKGV